MSRVDDIADFLASILSSYERQGYSIAPDDEGCLVITHEGRRVQVFRSYENGDGDAWVVIR